MLKFSSKLISTVALAALLLIVSVPAVFAQIAPIPSAGNNSTGVAIPPLPSSGGLPGAPAPVPNASSSDNVGGNNPDTSENRALNQPQTTNTGSFLNIGLPASHGLPGSNGVNAVLNTVIGNVLSFIALIAIVGLVYSGIQLFAAQGKADAIGNAKQNIFGIIIGFVVVMLAWSGVNILLRFIGFTS